VVVVVVVELQHLSLALSPSQTMRTGHWLVVVMVVVLQHLSLALSPSQTMRTGH
jgi:hypothetical protein